MTATTSGQLKLGAFLFTPGNHIAGWRHPDADLTTDMVFKSYVELARVAERGLFDAVFFQDTAAVNGSADRATFLAGRRAAYGRVVQLEPATLIAALAPVTERIGLIATATTTYNEPYHVARRFASADHISGGRVGWNLVTSQIEDEAGNFGLDAHADHGDRYARAEEFVDVVTGLWRSWEIDAFAPDKDAGRYFDPAKVRYLDHEGQYFRVRGPLNVAAAPWGRPIISQAGSSEAGRALAARTADLVFTAQQVLEEAVAFATEIKTRARGFGRSAEAVKILPGLLPVIGSTQAEAKARFDALQALLPEDAGVSAIQRLTGGIDLTRYPLDGPLPELRDTNTAKGRQKLLVDLARREGYSIRQVARYFAAAGGHRVVVGTAEEVADLIETWFRAGAADGFNVMFPYFPGPVVDFVEQVVPLLQRRGIFREDYESTTLRGNLGLA
jgi:N-acetyl-S-(2-succino)cysteine monooxygenase